MQEFKHMNRFITKIEMPLKPFNTHMTKCIINAIASMHFQYKSNRNTCSVIETYDKVQNATLFINANDMYGLQLTVSTYFMLSRILSHFLVFDQH